MSARPHLLLVEDDPAIAQTVVFALEREGFAVTHCGWLHEARAALAAGPPEALILDVGLPDGNGLDLCRELRQTPAGARLPLIVLSARSEEMDRVLGLELGADDYLAKPFSPRELVARVRALLRRSEGRLAPAQQSMQELAGGFAIDEHGQRIAWQGQVLPLTPVEYRLLRLLLGQPGRVFERARLLDQIHEEFRDVSDRVVDSHVKNIRRKLAKLEPPQDCIAAVYGVGYRFEPR